MNVEFDTVHIANILLKQFSESAQKVSQKIIESAHENFEDNLDFQKTTRREKDEVKVIDLKTKFEVSPRSQIQIGSAMVPIGPIVINIVGEQKNIELIREDDVGVGSLDIKPNACILKWRLRTTESIKEKINCQLLRS